MKKSFMLIAAAAAMFAACQQEDVVIDQSSNNNVQQAIGFSTYTPSMTRAENSSATNTYALDNYHTTFKVWGYKNVMTDEALKATKVFDDVVCTYGIASGQFTGLGTSGKDWTYSPVRYWDKSATDYDFYAAAPSTASWTLKNEAETATATYQVEHGRYFTIAGAEVKGESLPLAKASEAEADRKVTGQPDDHFTKADKDNDLMIATDILKYDNYTTDRVNFHFNHILSRMNIGVKTTVQNTATDDQHLILKAVKVYNMYSKGNFDESKANTSSDPKLADGTVARWKDDTSGSGSPSVQTVQFGFPNTEITTSKVSDIAMDVEITSDTKAAYNEYKLVYQGLVIPQTVAYDGDLKLDGSNAVAAGSTGTASAPYVYIEYELNGETFKSYYNLAALFNGSMLAYKNVNNYPAYKTIWDGVYLFKNSTGYELENGTAVNYGFNVGDKFYGPEGKEIYFNSSDFKYYETFDGTRYDVEVNPQPEYWVAWNKYHNPIAVTNAEGNPTKYTVAVDFCEGWQNNLWITITPTAILFDADVYEWVTDKDAPVTVK